LPIDQDACIVEVGLIAPQASPEGVLRAGYYVNDRVRSLSQDGEELSFTLDPGRRTRLTTTAGDPQHTQRLHYSDPSDNPSWAETSADGGAWTRNVPELDGRLAATHDGAGATTTLQLANLHGDVVATAGAAPGSGLVTTLRADAFGDPQGGLPATGYGWLGAERRATVLPGGAMLMGARLYLPNLGRFTQVDPVLGGSANAYDYANQDPLNTYDLCGLFHVCTKAYDRPGGFDFIPACRAHDTCYARIRIQGLQWRARYRARLSCDQRFLSDMLAVCRKAPLFGRRAVCETWAWTYYYGVRDWGGLAL
jgi:RHS repeat-associated protein